MISNYVFSLCFAQNADTEQRYDHISGNNSLPLGGKYTLFLFTNGKYRKGEFSGIQVA